MTAEIIPAPSALAGQEYTLAEFLSTFSCETTRATYRKSAAFFAKWRGEPAELAFAELLALGPRAAAVHVERYRDSMVAQGLASATIASRLAPLRSFVKKQRVGWGLDVQDPRKEPRRDSRGPTWIAYLAIIDAEPSSCVRALLHVLGDRGLRIAEALAVELQHVEPDFGAVWVLGKGRKERERLTLSESTQAALRAWIAERGSEPGPVWPCHYATAWRWVKDAGARLGVRLAPHALRHTAITRALDVTDGDARKVRHFSRHSSLETILVYDDVRQDVAGEVARAVTG